MSRLIPEHLIPDKKLAPSTRIIAFIMGLSLGCILFVYSFDYAEFPYTFTILGYSFTEWIMIAGLVLLTVLASWLIQIAIRGRTGF